MKIPFIPEGHNALAYIFAAALIGLTFGGKHFGHGVFTLAPGRFELWQYEVAR